ncbi:MAG: hypothetical protein ACO1OB_24220 [Archangium sp.]
MKKLWLALLLVGCDESKTAVPQPVEPKSSLRVPLPDGWKASAMAGGLQAGPQGRVVLQLESTSKPLPEPAEFIAAVEREGVSIQQKEAVESFVGVRYRVNVDGAAAAKRDAFVGVRKTGPRTIWCSTTSSAKSEEVEAAMTVCRSLSWEG